jgi:cell division protein ZapA (FtsZ GTPase activity inhibitor)
MGEGEFIQITVTIAGRPYPLKIMSSNESVIRRIVREVNEQMNKFQLDYPNRDKQDCLALTAMGIAVELDKAKQSADPDLPEQLALIDDTLDALLR